jgi:hypothetical protein
MTYTISWDNDEKSLILLHFDAPLTWEIVHEGYDELGIMMRSVTHTVDWITDVSDTSNMPKENATEHLRALLNRIAPNAGMNVVLVNQSSIFTIWLLKSFVRIVAWGRGFAIASSLSEAREMVQQHRAVEPEHG